VIPECSSLTSDVPGQSGHALPYDHRPLRAKNRRYAHHVEPMFGKRPVRTGESLNSYLHLPQRNSQAVSCLWILFFRRIGDPIR
jgi:hypothetical protein